MIDRKFLNVIVLGLGFMFLFTAFQTMGNIEKTVLDSIQSDDSEFTGDGYTSLAVIYAVFALCNWLAPSAITITGPRGAMVFGSITYCLFMVSFLWPQTWLLYAASALLGFGAALTWTGQGAHLAACSTDDTISRNSGVFWAMLQASMFFGNLFVYFEFQGKTHIDAPTRSLVFSVLVAVAVVGVVFLAALRPPPGSASQSAVTELPDTRGPLEALKGAYALFLTKDMVLLSLTFLYTGLELSFFSGVYSPSIGFTLNMGEEAKQLVGLSGICIGIGEVLGGIIFGILGKKTNRWGRDPVVLMGYFVHLAAFFMIFLNLPDTAPFGDTRDAGFLDPPVPSVALICSLLLGLGDACFNTQIYAMLGGTFCSDSASAFALFKFTQSVAAALSFVYSSHFGLRCQLVILLIFATLGTATFCAVEWRGRRRARQELRQSDMEKQKALTSNSESSE